MKMDVGYALFVAFWVWLAWLAVRKYLRAQRPSTPPKDGTRFVVTGTVSSEVAAQDGPPNGVFFVSPDDPAPMQRWSGVDHGPLPIKALTVAQDMCLSDAAREGARLVRSTTSLPGYVLAGSDMAPHPTRTVVTLARHGLLVASGDDYVIADKGLQALETLRWRS